MRNEYDITDIGLGNVERNTEPMGNDLFYKIKDMIKNMERKITLSK